MVVIGIILGLAFLQGINDIVVSQTDIFTVDNETFDTSSGRTSSGNEMNPDTGIALGQVGVIQAVQSIRMPNGTILTPDGDYLLNTTNNKVHFLNTSSMASYANTTEAYYTYVSSDYLESSTNRTFIKLAVLFFVIAIFAVALYGFWNKDWNF